MICFGEQYELGGSFRIIWIFIRVEFASEMTVGKFDFVIGGVGGNAKDVVGIELFDVFGLLTEFGSDLEQDKAGCQDN